jgi:hypothetical protein
MSCFRLCALLGIVVAVAGCGLPDSYFLVPPVAGVPFNTTTANNEFQIVGTDRGTDTGATFLGYELYYKFYGSTSGTGSGASFNSDLTSFGTGSTYIDLQQAGFHRLCLGTSLNGLTADTSAGYARAPVVNIDQILRSFFFHVPSNIKLSYTVRIRLNDLAVPLPPAPQLPANSASLSYFVYVPPGTSTATAYGEVRRFVTMPGASGCKMFASNSIALGLNSGNPTNYNSGNDVDLSGGAATAYSEAFNNSNPIIVMIYALSYGKSNIDGTPVYSSPVLLGYGGAQISP